MHVLHQKARIARHWSRCCLIEEPEFLQRVRTMKASVPQLFEPDGVYHEKPFGIDFGSRFKGVMIEWAWRWKEDGFKRNSSWQELQGVYTRNCCSQCWNRVQLIWKVMRVAFLYRKTSFPLSVILLPPTQALLRVALLGHWQYKLWSSYITKEAFAYFEDWWLQRWSSNFQLSLYIDCRMSQSE